MTGSFILMLLYKNRERGCSTVEQHLDTHGDSIGSSATKKRAQPFRYLNRLVGHLPKARQ